MSELIAEFEREVRLPQAGVEETIASVDPCFTRGPYWHFVRWKDAENMVIVCRNAEPQRNTEDSRP